MRRITIAANASVKRDPFTAELLDTGNRDPNSGELQTPALDTLQTVFSRRPVTLAPQVWGCVVGEVLAGERIYVHGSGMGQAGVVVSLINRVGGAVVVCPVEAQRNHYLEATVPVDTPVGAYDLTVSSSAGTSKLYTGEYVNETTTLLTGENHPGAVRVVAGTDYYNTGGWPAATFATALTRHYDIGAAATPTTPTLSTMDPTTGQLTATTTLSGLPPVTNNDYTARLQALIDLANTAGGGKIWFAAGDWNVGSDLGIRFTPVLANTGNYGLTGNAGNVINGANVTAAGVALQKSKNYTYPQSGVEWIGGGRRGTCTVSSDANGFPTVNVTSFQDFSPTNLAGKWRLTATTTNGIRFAAWGPNGTRIEGFLQTDGAGAFTTVSNATGTVEPNLSDEPFVFETIPKRAQASLLTGTNGEVLSVTLDTSGANSGVDFYTVPKGLVIPRIEVPANAVIIEGSGQRRTFLHYGLTNHPLAERIMMMHRGSSSGAGIQLIYMSNRSNGFGLANLSFKSNWAVSSLRADTWADYHCWLHSANTNNRLMMKNVSVNAQGGRIMYGRRIMSRVHLQGCFFSSLQRINGTAELTGNQTIPVSAHWMVCRNTRSEFNLGRTLFNFVQNCLIENSVFYRHSFWDGTNEGHYLESGIVELSQSRKMLVVNNLFAQFATDNRSGEGLNAQRGGSTDAFDAGYVESVPSADRVILTKSLPWNNNGGNAGTNLFRNDRGDLDSFAYFKIVKGSGMGQFRRIVTPYLEASGARKISAVKMTGGNVSTNQSTGWTTPPVVVDNTPGADRIRPAVVTPIMNGTICLGFFVVDGGSYNPGITPALAVSNSGGSNPAAPTLTPQMGSPDGSQLDTVVLDSYEPWDVQPDATSEWAIVPEPAVGHAYVGNAIYGSQWALGCYEGIIGGFESENKSVDGGNLLFRGIIKGYQNFTTQTQTYGARVHSGTIWHVEADSNDAVSYGGIAAGFALSTEAAFVNDHKLIYNVSIKNTRLYGLAYVNNQSERRQTGFYAIENGPNPAGGAGWSGRGDAIFTNNTFNDVVVPSLGTVNPTYSANFSPLVGRERYRGTKIPILVALPQTDTIDP